MLSLLRVRVQPLVEELRSCKSAAQSKQTNKNQIRIVTFHKDDFSEISIFRKIRSDRVSLTPEIQNIYSVCLLGNPGLDIYIYIYIGIKKDFPEKRVTSLGASR